jgi:hypothetical protein
MKKLAWWSLLPLVAFAATRDDYASQWPLALQREDSGAYRVVLDREVIPPAAIAPAAGPGRGQCAGHAGGDRDLPADAPLARSGTAVSLPWFPLPVDAGASRQDIAAISEIATDGSLRRVEMRAPGTATAATGDGGFVVDASQLRRPLAALRHRVDGCTARVRSRLSRQRLRRPAPVARGRCRRAPRAAAEQRPAHRRGSHRAAGGAGALPAPVANVRRRPVH